MLLHYLTEVGRCLAQQFFFLLLTFGLHLAMCPQITCRFSSLCKIDIAKYQKLRFRKMTLSHPQEMLTGCWHAPHMQVTADHDHQIYYYSCTFLSEPSILFFFFFIVSNEINTRLQYLTPRIFHEWQKRYSEIAPWLNQLLTWGFLLTHTERQPRGSLQYQTGTTPDQAEVYRPDCLGSHIPGQSLISIFFSSNNAFVQLCSIDIYNENIHSFISIFVFDVRKFCAYMHV